MAATPDGAGQRSHRPIRHLGAAAVACAHVVLLLAGAPGLDFLQARPDVTPAWLGFASTWDHAVRQPLIRPLARLERVLGVRQDWYFYGTGASRHRRFEIYVDGERWLHVNHATDRFLAAQFANPRLRHLMKGWVKRGRYEAGLLRYVGHQVRRVAPEAQVVELVATEARFPRGGRTELRRARLEL